MKRLLAISLIFAIAILPVLSIAQSGQFTSAAPTLTNGNINGLQLDARARLQVTNVHPNLIACTVAVSTATTVQAVGGSCVAPGAGLSLYITDVSFGSSAASSTAADSFPTLKYGTGGTCGAGTTVWWQALSAANTTVIDNFVTPFKAPANNELCWIMTTAGSKTVQIRGYIAP